MGWDKIGGDLYTYRMKRYFYKIFLFKFFIFSDSSRKSGYNKNENNYSENSDNYEMDVNCVTATV
jgi:hypothetical protein